MGELKRVGGRIKVPLCQTKLRSPCKLETCPCCLPRSCLNSWGLWSHSTSVLLSDQGCKGSEVSPEVADGRGGSCLGWEHLPQVSLEGPTCPPAARWQRVFFSPMFRWHC